MDEPEPEGEPHWHPQRLANPNARRPVHSKKEYDRLAKAAWKAGWWLERKSNGYIYCYPPGRNGVVVLKSTPRKQGSWNLARDRMKKLGVEI